MYIEQTPQVNAKSQLNMWMCRHPFWHDHHYSCFHVCIFSSSFFFFAMLCNYSHSIDGHAIYTHGFIAMEMVNEFHCSAILIAGLFVSRSKNKTDMSL